MEAEFGILRTIKSKQKHSKRCFFFNQVRKSYFYRRKLVFKVSLNVNRQKKKINCIDKISFLYNQWPNFGAWWYGPFLLKPDTAAKARQCFQILTKRNYFFFLNILISFYVALYVNEWFQSVKKTFSAPKCNVSKVLNI